MSAKALRSTRLGTWLLLGTLLAASLPSPAWANPEQEAAPPANPTPAAEAPPEHTAKASSPTTEEGEARQLFLDGLAQLRAGSYDEACFLFEQSLSLVDRVTTRFNLADCLEKRGEQVRALELFLDVAEKTRELGDKAREAAALERAQALTGQLCKLRIAAEEALGTLSVVREGKPVERASWEQGALVERGAYQVQILPKSEASSESAPLWSVEVQIPVCPAFVAVKIPALDHQKVEVQQSIAANKAATEPPPKATPEDRGASHGGDTGQTTVTLGYALGGLGIVALATGGVFAQRYYSRNAEAKRVCPTSFNCTLAEVDRHRELVSEAKSARTLAWVGGSVGVVAVSAASMILLTEWSRPEAGLSLRGGALLGADRRPAGILVEGRF